MRLMFAAALAMSLAGSALADDTDTFNVKGTSPDGSAYTGTVALTELSLGAKGDVFKVVWNIGGQTTEGVAIVSEENRKVLAIGYTYGGKTGVAVMTEDGGKAAGSWWVDGAPGTGTEEWTPAQ